MTKRLCPFNSDFLPQSKMYISEKVADINKGQLDHVYSKTLQILFEGAKRSCQSVKNDHYPLSNKNVHTNYLKQSILDKNGEINRNPNLQEDTQLRRCVGCINININPNDNEKMKCSFCEHLFCGNCVQTCMQCEFIFCKVCSLPVYRADDEQYICLSCHS